MNYFTSKKIEKASRQFRKSFIVSLLGTTLIFAGAAFTWCVTDIYQSQKNYTETSRQQIKLIELNDKIIYLSENLTQSAQILAVTGRDEDEEKYYQYETQLNQTLGEADALAHDERIKFLIENLRSTRKSLTNTEKQSCLLIRKHQFDKGEELLRSREYANQQEAFESLLQKLSNEIKNFQPRSNSDRLTFPLLILAVIIFLVALLTCLATILSLYKSQKELTRGNLERDRALDALRRSETRGRELFENASDLIFTTDLEENLILFNKAGILLTGYTHEEISRMKISDLVASESLDLVRKMREQKLSGTAATKYELQIRSKNGEFLTLEVNTSPILENGKITGFQGIGRDITERKLISAAKLKAEQYQNLFKHANDAIIIFEPSSSIILEINDKACEMYNFTREELIGQNLNALSQHADSIFGKLENILVDGKCNNLESVHLRKCGAAFDVLINADVIDYQATVAILCTIRDITERKQFEEKLQHHAFYDNLTGLANRTLFMEHLRLSFEDARHRQDELFAVLFLDFDRFKVINDSLGHIEGDNFLKMVARRLEKIIRPNDLLARLGGDEFTILLNKINSKDEAVRVAERIQENLEKSFTLGGRELYTSASIGIVLNTFDYKNGEEMLRDADIAMYQAKAKGKAQYQIFNQTMYVKAKIHLQIETDLREALEKKELKTFYQPIINLETGALTGFEALVRWQHPTRGLIPPNEFIPAAEENGLIIPLGYQVLKDSCRQLRKWQQSGKTFAGLTVNVNLSSKQFLQFDLAEQIATILDEAKLPADSLKLEITESHLMENSAAALSIISKLHNLGVELCLDDFGTGYSSLSYLHRLPVKYLKIDRLFVSRMTESPENTEIIHTIIKLAQNLKMEVVAEGIETKEQLEHLKSLNCRYGQGYFFAKPADETATGDFIRKYLGDHHIDKSANFANHITNDSNRLRI